MTIRHFFPFKLDRGEQRLGGILLKDHRGRHVKMNVKGDTWLDKPMCKLSSDKLRIEEFWFNPNDEDGMKKFLQSNYRRNPQLENWKTYEECLSKITVQKVNDFEEGDHEERIFGGEAVMRAIGKIALNFYLKYHN
ncbi:MAG TPA: hypothetical protein VHS96_09525, partial [Bacteroidia bacterium]|nr:hypothetical protein [Bacteroidia bacterium]